MDIIGRRGNHVGTRNRHAGKAHAQELPNEAGARTDQ